MPKAVAVIDVSAIVVNYNTRHLLAEAIDALRKSAADLTLQIIIVDNASRDGSAEFIRQTFPDLELIVNATNVGFGRANNQALNRCRGRYVLLVNTDAFVEIDTVPKTVAYMDQHPDCGVLGVRLEGRQGELQPSCRYFPTPLNTFLVRTGFSKFAPQVQLVDDMRWDHGSERACDWVPGCYYLCRRSVLDQVGLFDPRYFLYFEEVDHCQAVKASGSTVIYYPHTRVVHLGGESAISDSEITSSGRQISVLQTESELLYFRKHGGPANLALHLILSTFADTMFAIKALLVRRSAALMKSHLAQIGQMWSLLAKTRLATRPTR